MNRAAPFSASLLGLALITPALAAPTLGVQADFSSPLGQTSSLGTGVTGTLGYGVDLALIEVIPELGASWFGASRRLLPRVGGRVMVGKIVEPGAYAHVVFADGLSLAPGRAGWDAGVMLDITAVPHLDIGLHGGVLALPSGGERPATHLTGGLHMGITF
jgi:hypothetical protein